LQGAKAPKVLEKKGKVERGLKQKRNGKINEKETKKSALPTVLLNHGFSLRARVNTNGNWMRSIGPRPN